MGNCWQMETKLGDMVHIKPVCIHPSLSPTSLLFFGKQHKMKSENRRSCSGCFPQRVQTTDLSELHVYCAFPPLNRDQSVTTAFKHCPHQVACCYSSCWPIAAVIDVWFYEKQQKRKYRKWKWQTTGMKISVTEVLRSKHFYFSLPFAIWRT